MGIKRVLKKAAKVVGKAVLKAIVDDMKLPGTR